MTPPAPSLVQVHFTFHRSPGVGAAMIRARSRGWASHVGILVTVPGLDLLKVRIVEARRRHGDGREGVAASRSVSEAIAGGDEVRVFRLPAVSMEQDHAALRWLDAQHGKGYDDPGLRGFIPIPLPFGLGASRQQQDERRMAAEWWCSELAKAYADQRGVPLLGTSATRLDPGMPGVYVEPWRVDPDLLMCSPFLTEVALPR